MNSLNNATIIGLTGQSGAGKTTVSQVFEKNGFAIINADKISRELIQKDSVCLKNVLDVFPECIDEETKDLNRKRLASIVFNDKGLLKLLNSIMYPYITTKILNEIRNYSSSGNKYILLDAPTLFESRTDDFCNFIISVIADESCRQNRIQLRDSISPEEAESRFSSQNDDEYYISRSDYVIHNNGTVDELISEAKKVSSHIKEIFNA